MAKKSLIIFDFTAGRAYRLSGWRLRVHEWKSRWQMRHVRMTCEGLPPSVFQREASDEGKP